MAKTAVRKPTRNTSDYFVGMFNTLSPIRFQEINWKSQKYANVNSAAGSVRSIADRNHLNGINVKTWKDRLFVYSNDYMGILPFEKNISMSEAFRRADICLRKNPLIEYWPIPNYMLPKDTELSVMQIGMTFRDELKSKYPYLTIKTSGNDGSYLSVARDRSYGNLIFDDPKEEDVMTEGTTTMEEPESVDIQETVATTSETLANAVEEIKSNLNERFSLYVDKDQTSRTFVQDEEVKNDMTVMPALPFDVASSVATHLCADGYTVSIDLVHKSEDKCYGIVSYTK